MQGKNRDFKKEGVMPSNLWIEWHRFVFLSHTRHAKSASPCAEPPEPRAAAPTPGTSTRAVENALAEKPSKAFTLKASIAELLLVSKLHACSLLSRHHPHLAESKNHDEAERKAMLARYAQVLSVTCKHWFPKACNSPRPTERQL